MTTYDAALFWFRRDLRFDDNAGLYYALRSSRRVHCVFVFDSEILDPLPSRSDRRVEFIHGSVAQLQAALRGHGGELIVASGRAREVIPKLAASLRADAVFANEDYEPAAIDRDASVAQALGTRGAKLHLAKDQALLHKDEVLTRDGAPYSVFTPYRNAWLAKLDEYQVKSYPVASHAAALAPPPAPAAMPALESLGFAKTNLEGVGIHPGAAAARALLADFGKRIDTYRKARDFPAVKGVSYLSVHNRFGTISIRELAAAARKAGGAGAETWLSELAWRDFYFQILWHHPHAATGAFRREYDAIRWPDDERLFAAWREAATGYPLVDAAMRQINTTGYMHNRLRMVAASFLVKDLLVDWRKGERYFAETLNDFDLAQNNGGWQWAASTGCDAQPYFRIFNPVTQSERFDREGRFIRRYLPELARVPDKFIHAPWTMDAAQQRAAGCVIGEDYPAPVVDHAVQREKALALYGKVKR